MKRPYLQKGWLYEGDRRFGFILDKKAHEKYPTIDICWWWGWVMIFFASRKEKK